MTLSRTYLDWNATAPLRPQARAAMVSALDIVGNPSSIHAEGRRARALIDDARDRIAALVGVASADVVFTSGATEANVTVMGGGWSTIFVSAIEHESVVDAARATGARIVDIPVRLSGVVEAGAIADDVLAGRQPTGRALITIQHANNETGVMQPVGEIAEFARAHGIATHSDAVQTCARDHR